MDYQVPAAEVKLSVFLFNRLLQVKLSIEALMEEIKPVLSETFELKHRDQSFLIVFFLETSDDLETDSRMKTNAFFKFFSCIKFSIEILMEEIKQIFAERSEFEYRDRSVMIALFGNFGVSRTQREEQNHQFFKRTNPVQVEIFRLKPK